MSLARRERVARLPPRPRAPQSLVPRLRPLLTAGSAPSISAPLPQPHPHPRRRLRLWRQPAPHRALGADREASPSNSPASTSIPMPIAIAAEASPASKPPSAGSPRISSRYAPARAGPHRRQFTLHASPRRTRNHPLSRNGWKQHATPRLVHQRSLPRRHSLSSLSRFPKLGAPSSLRAARRPRLHRALPSFRRDWQRMCAAAGLDRRRRLHPAFKPARLCVARRKSQ